MALKIFILSIVLHGTCCFGALNSYVGRFTGDGTGLTNIGAADVVWPVAGTNITMQTNGLAVTINASGGGAITPWTGDIDGAGWFLTNAGGITVTGSVVGQSLYLSGLAHGLDLTATANPSIYVHGVSGYSGKLDSFLRWSTPGYWWFYDYVNATNSKVVTGPLFADLLTGDGSGLTNLTLSADVPLLSAVNTFANNNFFTAGVVFGGGIDITASLIDPRANPLVVESKAVFGSSATPEFTNQVTVITAAGKPFLVGTNGVIYGDGSGLTNLTKATYVSDSSTNRIPYTVVTNAPWATTTQLADATNHTVPASLFPALTGDITTPGGSLATTLATVATPGTSTKVTYNAKGLVTSGTTLSAGDIPTLTVAKLSDAGTAAYSNSTVFAPAQSGTIVTQNNSFSLVMSNAMKFDAAHSLSLSNATASRLAFVGADNTVGSASVSGAVPANGDGSATTFAQVNALAPGFVVTNGLTQAVTLSNNVTVDAAHSLATAAITNTGNIQSATLNTSGAATVGGTLSVSTINGPSSFINLNAGGVGIFGIGGSSVTAYKDTTINANLIVTNTITVTNYIAFPTNYVAANFVPVAGKVTFPISNGVMYKVTQLSTNLHGSATP